MNNFIDGMNYFLSGFSLITKPGIKRFVIIPLIINIVIFTALFFVLRHYLVALNAWFLGYLPAWLQWLSWILWLLFIASFFLIFIYLFVTIGNFVSAPFNSFLAEKVELYLTGKMSEPRTLMENIKDIPRILGRQFAILGYFIPRALFILLLFFVPIIQAVAALLWFLFSAWYMTLTYLDYPSDNHRISIQEVHVWLKDKRWVGIGFGISVLAASMIPVVNFFTIPAAVAGATQFWIKEGKNNSKGHS